MTTILLALTKKSIFFTFPNIITIDGIQNFFYWLEKVVEMRKKNHNFLARAFAQG